MTKAKILKQIASGSCKGIDCEEDNCPLDSFCSRGENDHIPILIESELHPAYSNEAQRRLDEIEINKEIEEFLKDD